MNLSLLVTKKNIEEMRKTALKMGEAQDAPVNGAFCVFYDITIPKDEIARLIAPISGKFAAMSYGPVQVNGSMSNDLQLAVLFGHLIIQAYSRFPGAWMIVDSFSAPLIPNFMQACEKQHKGLGGGITGKGVVSEGSVLPVGPTIISLPHRAIKFLRYPVSTSWRERGRFQFARCRFVNVSADDYYWSLSETKAEPKEEKQEQEEVFSIDFDEADKNELIDYITKISGRSPARNTGYPRLIAMAKELSELQKTPA